jgi:hypothetical protein
MESTQHFKCRRNLQKHMERQHQGEDPESKAPKRSTSEKAQLQERRQHHWHQRKERRKSRVKKPPVWWTNECAADMIKTYAQIEAMVLAEKQLADKQDQPMIFQLKSLREVERKLRLMAHLRRRLEHELRSMAQQRRKGALGRQLLVLRRVFVSGPQAEATTMNRCLSTVNSCGRFQSYRPRPN